MSLAKVKFFLRNDNENIDDNVLKNFAEMGDDTDSDDDTEDSAYPCLKHLLCPYRDNGHLSPQEKNYNFKLSQCRVDIENTFGILKQRFRVLYHCKLKNIKLICHLIRACCTLHNMSQNDEIEIDDITNEELKLICHLIRACCTLHNMSQNDEIEIDDITNEEFHDDDTLGYIPGEPAEGWTLRNEVSRKLPMKYSMMTIH
ncbi:DDE superfamily endonuclease [Popillia japonica]|uniref:DDE superfamily endonuclease n=1 Tax=Popillia japonica TaxID=7064 RepID=A0AAW1HW60_POPJA